MAYQGVTLKNTVPANDLTFILADEIKEEHVGLAVVQDSSAANTVKLATDGAKILGRLENVEDRKVEGIKVGAVKIIGGMALKKSGDIAVGDMVLGAGNGLVKKDATSAGAISDLAVWEVNGDEVIVVKTH